MTTKTDDKKKYAPIYWWEKSVEYTFIAKMVEQEMFVFASPFAGHTEAAIGDAVIKWEGDLLLIEFKVDGSIPSLSSEHEKYTDKKDVISRRNAFNEAMTALSTEPSAKNHLLIFGQQDLDQLQVYAVPYWTASADDPVKAIEWCRNKSNDPKNIIISADEFDDYLHKLSAKRRTKSENGSSGSREFCRSSVVGIGKNGKSFVLDLADYNKIALNRKKELKKQSENESISTLSTFPSTGPK